ncbi:hypothetical protein GCM10010245_87290 [Streptomyces spectabilis]|nr:hypothetical protein GCM10010245_87290 [Streptomyces spectabilis]
MCPRAGWAPGRRGGAGEGGRQLHLEVFLALLAPECHHFAYVVGQGAQFAGEEVEGVLRVVEAVGRGVLGADGTDGCAGRVEGEGVSRFVSSRLRTRWARGSHSP